MECFKKQFIQQLIINYTLISKWFRKYLHLFSNYLVQLTITGQLSNAIII